MGDSMELMEAVDPVDFEAWIETNFTVSGEMRCESTINALQRLIVDAVVSPQVTILSRAVAQTGVDEIQARMALALICGLRRTQSKSQGRATCREQLI
jgi:hypothetical protein